MGRTWGDKRNAYRIWKTGITGSVDFVHRPELEITGKHNVSETGSVSVFRRREGDTYSVGSLRNC
jgi:hypothetical protein